MEALVYDQTYPGAGRAGMTEPVETAVSPMLIFSIMRRRKVGIFLIAIPLCAAAIALISTVRPSFVATASVLVQERKPIIADIATFSGTIATDSVAVRTQADILRSADLARSIVQEMQLIDLIEFSPAKSSGPPWLLLALKPYDRFGVLDRFSLLAEPPALTPHEREELATQTLLGMTTVVNDGRSYVIDVKVKVTARSSAEAPEAAKLSAALANAYVRVYTQFTGKVKKDTLRQAFGLFDERIASLQAKMRAAEAAVQTYRVDTGLIEDRAAGGNGRPVTIASQQLAQLSAELITAVADRSQKEASLQQVTAAASGKIDLRSVPEVVSSPLVQRLREQQAELGAKEAALATTRGIGSPDLQAARGSQRDIAGKIAAETVNIAVSLRNSVQTAKARESAVRGHLAKVQTEVGVQGLNEVKLRELENEADIARAIYSTYFKRAQETATQVDMQEPDALIVSRAGIPLRAAPPSKSTLAIASAVMSFFAATLIALVRERMQPGFRGSEQFTARTGIETLGFLPKVRNVRRALAFGNRDSAFSQSVFSIRALLKISMGRGDAQVVMVTSALPREGKTLLCSALARNAALAGERVLLIDCDLRRPAVGRNISANVNDAFADVTIHRDDSSSLDIVLLMAGSSSPQDLFASTKMRSLMTMLRERYDLILLDAPPTLAVSDARVLSLVADVTVLAVCWNRTPQALINAAVAGLRSSGARLAGAVITQVNFGDLAPEDGGAAYAYRGSRKRLV